ncbi:CocE/NonD family hydrolase [Parasphingorhabdus pacifica]
MAIALAACVIAGVSLWSLDEDEEPAAAPPRHVLLDVVDGPNDSRRAQIDVTLFAPPETPAPAVILAHGFGEDKNSVTQQARKLTERGFTVLTYSSRGFGNSTGRIALNSPDYEVTDARQIVDWLARQPEVLRDANGDPRVGVTGSSYGGALSLLLAGSDERVDAIAPVMTYNDLGRALLPNAASEEPITGDSPAAGSADGRGVFKEAWAGLLFSAGATPTHGSTTPPDESLNSADGGTTPRRAGEGPTTAPTKQMPLTCGNFIREVCRTYTEVAENGRASRQTSDLLDSVSPKSVTSNIDVPTLLVQGTQDTLFGLDQADANARQITEAGGEVKMIWYAGGHDGGAPSAELRDEIADWFAFHLREPGKSPVSDPGTGFEYEIEGDPRGDDEAPVRRMVAPTYPGTNSPRTPRFSMNLQGEATTVINPPGGRPAATSSLPGSSAAQEAADDFGHSLAKDIPGQVAVFSTDPADSRLVISGVPLTRLSVASVPGQPNSGEAVLFTKLYDVGPDGNRDLTGNAVSPIRVSDLPRDGSSVEVNVALPGIVHSLEAGHHLELAVTTTDQAYTTPDAPAAHRIDLAGSESLSVPSVRGTSTTGHGVPVPALLGIGTIALLGLAVWAFAAIRGRHSENADPALGTTPLAITELTKSYPDGFTAVEKLSIRVESGQIVGLLGPNGAGKTTTLRMLLGLLHPSSGQVHVFGHRVFPGAPVLSRVGALVEEPGFLPHLSGADNLHYYWAATGRPSAEARVEETLRIAGLEKHETRRVGEYSRGMKQRLAIAQSMLGLPELLILDEPTNGLDPPQIRQMREILRRYAATGRAVVLSSHLLSEIEQICTHVMVMHQGQLVTSGAVDEIGAVQGEVTFHVDEPALAVTALRALEGLGEVEADGAQVHAELAGHSPSIAVNALVAAGVLVSRVEPRRRLEDAFLQLVGEEQQ